ncbi:predicted protein [Verticillium alfalfae VaMs.102]|uniref:Predicted protein n=1 Tax=Verticillium alfalfae (strain VaMs.102 / ATCC MYA-4576 / FGSC 10136) TaxID=526221 RepID=C9SH17_VERA1|nr:predicted protein [Verticillium alfalfae VaMs.102]EEY17611.1 predicted protein [Verticillium alfalfae VaMs.102]
MIMSILAIIVLLLNWIVSVWAYLSLTNVLIPSVLEASLRLIQRTYWPIVRAFALAVGFLFSCMFRLILFFTIDLHTAVREFRHRHSRLARSPRHKTKNLKDVNIRDTAAVAEY